MRPSNDIVITGYGALTPLGRAGGALWPELLAANGRFHPIEHFDPGRAREHRCGFVRDAALGGTPLGHPRRVTALLAEAARDALGAAGLSASAGGANVAIVVGTTYAGGEAFQGAHRAWRAGEAARDVPREAMSGLLAHDLARELGAKGAAVTLGDASASGAVAIGYARDLLASGACDVAIAAAVDVVTESAFHGLYSLRTLAPEGSRPFHPERRGIRISEGAAAVVLERADSARARGATARARVSGYGGSSLAAHVARPDPTGIAYALRAALADAELAPRDVGYVNVHGAGTALGDTAEAAALADVFGEHLAALPVSSTKPALGHMQGAAGLIEALVVVFAIEQRALPPTAGLDALDPAFAHLDHVRAARHGVELRHGVSISCGLGGVNTATLLSKHAEG